MSRRWAGPGGNCTWTEPGKHMTTRERVCSVNAPSSGHSSRSASQRRTEPPELSGSAQYRRAIFTRECAAICFKCLFPFPVRAWQLNYRKVKYIQLSSKKKKDYSTYIVRWKELLEIIENFFLTVKNTKWFFLSLKFTTTAAEPSFNPPNVLFLHFLACKRFLFHVINYRRKPHTVAKDFE